MTEIIKIDPVKPEKEKIETAARIIKRGGIVAFPTETVYGLGANALNEGAVSKVYAAKGRPKDNPMIVHVAKRRDVFKLAVNVTSKVVSLTNKFWPGPLTIVLKKSKTIPDAVTAGRDTVAIRMPSHPIALALVKASGVPIAAPSANASGRPSATAAGHVIEDFAEKVDMIIDGGETEVGLESTVIDMTEKIPTILRPGKITAEELRKVLGKVSISSGSSVAPRSPGMKYKHYSPRAKIILVTGKKRLDRIEKLSEDLNSKGKKVAVMATKNRNYSAEIVAVLSSPEKYAHHLFSSFREFDKKGIDVILAEGISEKKLGLAIMNRLKKAATEIRT